MAIKELMSEFQLEYEKRGSGDMLYQVPYLSGLAESYAERHDWPSLLKVCVTPRCGANIIEFYIKHKRCRLVDQLSLCLGICMYLRFYRLTLCLTRAQ